MCIMAAATMPFLLAQRSVNLAYFSGCKSGGGVVCIPGAARQNLSRRGASGRIWCEKLSAKLKVAAFGAEQSGPLSMEEPGGVKTSDCPSETWEMGESSLIHAPVDKVWEMLRDFVHIERWLPVVSSSTLVEGEAQQPGAVRFVVTISGDTFYEKLIRLDEENHVHVYVVGENTGGLLNYQSTISLKEGSEADTTVMSWDGIMSPSKTKTKETIKSEFGGAFLLGTQYVEKTLSGSGSFTATT